MTKCKLGDLLDVARGLSLSGEHYATYGDKIRLTLANFDYVNNCFKDDDGKDNLFYDKVVPDKFILEEGRIITPLTEQTPGLLGSTARIPQSGTYIHSQDVGLISPIPEKLDSDFAFYLVSSKSVKEQLGARSQQTKIRHTSPDKIKDCTVFVPKIDEQRKVGKFLSSIDRLIQLSRKRIVELEKMAKEIYDYWFVQFDFPDKNGKPYKSTGGKMVYNPQLKREIPEGWEVNRLPDVADYLFGYTFDSKKFNTKGEGVRIVRIRNIADGFSNDYSSENPPEEYLIRNGDFLIGMDGYFNMNLWSGGESYLVQRSCRITAKDESYQGCLRRFLYPVIQQLEKKLQGATVAHLGKSHLDVIQVLVPKNANVGMALLNNCDSVIVKAAEQIRKLTALREFLLPLLMNGQAKMGGAA